MRIGLALVAVLALASPAAATELDFGTVTGSLALRGEVGYGNWITEGIYEVGVRPEERTLEAFAFALAGSGTLTYRTAVGIVENGRLVGDAWTSDWRTLTSGGLAEAVIEGGLYLDPGRQYVAYIVPAGAFGETSSWSVGTTSHEARAGFVGFSPQLYTEGHVVDLDLPHDRDVAMSARVTAVAEPASLLLLALGILVGVMRRSG